MEIVWKYVKKSKRVRENAILAFDLLVETSAIPGCGESAAKMRFPLIGAPQLMTRLMVQL